MQPRMDSGVVSDGADYPLLQVDKAQAAGRLGHPLPVYLSVAVTVPPVVAIETEICVGNTPAVASFGKSPDILIHRVVSARGARPQARSMPGG
jgi:hypothetical protein